MPDREKVISDLQEQIDWIRDNEFHKFPGWGHTVMAMKDALALLKEQEERYVSMVVSWLREIAINNVDSNREMTFLDAVEDIRDRASYGLKQYFIDKQEGR